MKCDFGNCRKKAIFTSEVTGKSFCEDHAFDYMIRTREDFLPKIEQPMKARV